MNVLQKARKVLKSALIFAMVFALCGTTLAKAYATYSDISTGNTPTKIPIKIEHVWDDNGNKPVKEDDTAGPREGLTVTVELTDENKTTVSMDGSETGKVAGEEKGSEAGEKEAPAFVDEVFKTEDAEAGVLLSEYMDAYFAYLDADEEDRADAEETMNAAWETLKSWCDKNVKGELEIPKFGNDSNMTDSFNDAYKKAYEDSFWKAFKEASDTKFEELQTEISTMEFTVDAEETPEATAKAAAVKVAENLTEQTGAELTDEQIGALSDAVADMVEKSEPGEGDIWKDTVKDLFDPTGALVGAALTSESLKDLENRGYTENKLELKIALVDDEENDKTLVYTSTDNGKTWKNEQGETIDPAQAFADVTGTVTEITYTFTHIYKQVQTKPEESKPTPTPVTPPEEEIKEPNVPLAEPELPQEEPPVEEPPVEEIDEPDVPLADIPETGDISDLWYGAALMMAAGLAVLLYQERRSRKTA